MTFFPIEDILLIQQELIEEFGGYPGVRDMGLLESALELPFQTFAGIELYPSVEAKAARIAFSVIQNHPFIDGNKRLGTHLMLSLLEYAGIEMHYTQEELIHIIYEVASGSADYSQLYSWIVFHQTEH